MNTRRLAWIPVFLFVFASASLAVASPRTASAPAADPIPAPSDVAAPPADAQTTASGLASKVLSPGTGTEHPVASDMVKVHYTGWTTDGNMFDSSVQRGKPTVFPLDKVIAGWTEGVQLMVEGEKRRFWIPAKLAYEGRSDRPQGMLVFDVELLDILRVPPTPPDVAAPPADAQRSESGLAWKVLKPGTGDRRPASKKSVVRVHYTGWTTDGKMFDSSISKGTPSTFPLDGVIPGWTEGLQLMTEGEVRRFWIPKKLAYRGAPHKPEGMLVFDVELVEIVKE
ncbi:MAG TPA: FKBP-type peptidyl-prolyl cis-trans isomerase [Thermoanaerobaculia bacterium]|nr:FKBP-type peptidyl-prolyl cis-trans isomerase [Thermoanaerobaculia bacterium]